MNVKPSVPNHIIRASAGTGKTFALSNRYLQLIAMGHNCDSILATTFTRKAAGEILDRIVQRLATAALSDQAAGVLAEQLETDLDKTRCQELLVDLMSKVHRLQISTLDSFFNRLSRSFSLELGLPLDWAISDNQLLNELSDQAVQEMLSSKRAIQLMHLLAKGEAQRGVARLLRRTVDDVYGIFLDSHEDAWNQLEEVPLATRDELDRLIAALEEAPPNGKQQTDRLNKDIDYARDGDWKEFAQSLQLRRILEGAKYGAAKRSAVLEDAYRGLADHVRGWICNDLKRKNQATHGLVSEYAERFKRKQEENGALRFDDVTLGLQSLVGARDANNRLMFRLDQQIEHLLLDEFQDTSPGQWQVIEPFAKWVSAKNSGRSFFCVGDMKQAIYGWRGGVAEIFDLVDERLENLDEADDLIKSYRSAAQIMEAVNDVFLNLKNVKTDCDQTNQELGLASEKFKAHSTHRAELAGHVTLNYGPDCAKELHRDQHKKRSARNGLMLDQMVEQIAELYRKCPDRSIGVLARSNDTVANIIFRLQKHNVPASQEGGNFLTDSAAVETVLAAIQLADHPGDTIARFLVSHSALGREFCLQPESTQTRKTNSKLVPVVAASLRKRLIDDGYGPTVEWLARILSTDCTPRELTRLQRLVELSYDYGGEWTLRADQFVAYIRETKVPDESAARVRVMTIHGAKGLEFDAVFLPVPSVMNWYQPPRFVVDRERPTDSASLVSLYVNRGLQQLLPEDFQQAFFSENRSKVREELCVLYVALTRAVHAMHIHVSYDCYPDKGKSFGRVLLNTLALGKENRSSEANVYEIGDPDWHTRDTKPLEELPVELKGFYLADDADIGEAKIGSSPRSGRGFDWTTPSRVDGVASTTRLSQVLRSQSDRESMHRGSLIHACFETIEWLSDEPVDVAKAKQSMLNRYPLISEEQMQAIVSEFEKMLEHKTISEFLTLETYRSEMTKRVLEPTRTIFDVINLRVENERPIAVQLDDEILEGFVDRVVWLYEGDELIGAEVIDFKSDRVKSQEVESYAEKYRSQLSVYVRAIQKISGLSFARIKCQLVFVESGIVVAVDCGKLPDQGGEKKGRPKAGGNGGSASVPDPKFKSNEQLRLW
jgi:ATP-dependent exoDNAse (exonuclease V) beta subunit